MAKIMLVEDDNNLREIYEARLQAEGYTIVSARDGEEALVVAKAEKPDLVISDVMMPKISGFEMLDILRNTDGLKEVKVIMLTALGQSDDQQRADKLGADRYLVKSQVTLEDIVKVTHELLQDTPTTPAPDPQTTSSPTASANQPDPVAPQPQPTPVSAATTPATEPATPPDPQTIPVAPEPPATNNSAAAQADTTSQEEAKVEGEIEDFVVGATEDPTTPTKPADQEIESSAQPSTQTSSEPADDTVKPAEPKQATNNSAAVPTAATANDDKLVADAAQALAASAGVADDDSAESVVIEPQAPEQPAAEPAKQDKEGGGVQIANKKVITPLAADPKKDIDVLLAIEEANEAHKADVPPSPVISGDTPAPDNAEAPEIPPAAPATGPVVAPETGQDGKVDPNSIAL